MRKYVILAVFLCLVSGNEATLQCFTCSDESSDEQCNSERLTCPSEVTKCITIVKNGNLLDKRCATTQDCIRGDVSTPSVSLSCCNSTLCNEVTSIWPRPAVNLLQESVGMEPTTFLTTVLTYQILFTLVYFCVVFYIVYSTPKGEKWNLKVSPETPFANEGLEKE
ncbi:lymphocyte antigen 6D-like [Clavelina lepadiformis]|uniref:lymphocyte antigen 6D-like n=1 Tax=Clavelina lepadiformis TaxID=159417 RepID=UPI0040414EAE